jgi:hypothetical protein
MPVLSYGPGLLAKLSQLRQREPVPRRRYRPESLASVRGTEHQPTVRKLGRQIGAQIDAAAAVLQVPALLRRRIVSHAPLTHSALAIVGTDIPDLPGSAVVVYERSVRHRLNAAPNEKDSPDGGEKSTDEKMKNSQQEKRPRTPQPTLTRGCRRTFRPSDGPVGEPSSVARCWCGCRSVSCRSTRVRAAPVRREDRHRRRGGAWRTCDAANAS